MKKNASLYSLLFIVFVDYWGVGLVYPLFSCMLFDHKYDLLPYTTSLSTRGVWLGVLFSLMPLATFFFAPLWGTISDNKGRKRPLLWSLSIGLIGYLLAFIGVAYHNLFLLLLSRILDGIAAGNASIVQAAIIDISPEDTKTKNLGLYSMACGAGFTLGPFCSSFIDKTGYAFPFLLAAGLVLSNATFLCMLFRETHKAPITRPFSWMLGMRQIHTAFTCPEKKTLFLCAFLNYFGWTYFFEFLPIYLLDRFHFCATHIALTLAFTGGFYALSCGLLIRPFISKYSPQNLFAAGLLGTGCAVYLLPLLPHISFLWPVLALICFMTSFTSPTASTLVSMQTPPQEQGEMLGVLQAVYSTALVIGPLLSGPIAGKYPTMPMWIGGSVLLVSAWLWRQDTRRSKTSL